jgi:nucleotide-binding universal stress UspA family protein
MYNRVVVPLDGSDLAEVALPHLQEIAKGCSIPQILLVSVTEKVGGRVTNIAAGGTTPTEEGHMAPPTGPYPLGSTYSGLLYAADPSNLSYVPTGLGKMASTAVKYLTKIAARLEKDGLQASAVVLVGNPAEEIVRYAKEKKADLIVMASRGKSGFNRWDMGNVADKVIRATDIPVVLVKPKAGFKETKPKRKGKPN